MKGMMIFLLVLVFCGCADKPGRGILDEKKMMSVMWDLMQADEFATTYVSRDSSVDLVKARFKLYKDVYRINNLDEKTFSESYKYYTGRPDLMKKIFDSLTTKGERERQKLYQPVDTSAAAKFVVTDSLKRDSLRSAFKFRDSIRIDSMKQVMAAQDTAFKKKLLAEKKRRFDSLRKTAPKRRKKQ